MSLYGTYTHCAPLILTHSYIHYTHIHVHSDVEYHYHYYVHRVPYVEYSSKQVDPLMEREEILSSVGVHKAQWRLLRKRYAIRVEFEQTGSLGRTFIIVIDAPKVLTMETFDLLSLKLRIKSFHGNSCMCMIIISGKRVHTTPTLTFFCSMKL